jgi:hypothetical protein
MKKRILLLVAFATCLSASSQEAYFKSGKNFTMYHYKDVVGDVNNSFETELGSVYELGYSSPINGFNHFSYAVALTLNEFNSIVGKPDVHIRWKTEYVGIQPSISYSFVNTDRFSLAAEVGYNASVIVYGKEDINTVISDLKNTDGFKGLIVQQLLGLEAKFHASKQAYFSLGYNYLNSFDSDKGPEVFSIETNQIVLGVHFMLEKKQSKVTNEDKK